MGSSGLSAMDGGAIRADRKAVPEPPARVLRAFLSVDVVGYTASMARNDRATLRALQACRGAIDDLVARHGGQVFGVAGDSAMAAFAEASAALRTAFDIQAAVSRINAGHALKLQLRIGLNYGKAIEEEGALYGDGVNVAARVMAFGGAGDIHAAAAFKSLFGQRPDCHFLAIGRQHLKGFSKAMEIFKVIPAGGAIPILSHRAKRLVAPWRWMVGAAAAGALAWALLFVPGFASPREWIERGALAFGLEAWVLTPEKLAARGRTERARFMVESERLADAEAARKSAEAALAEALRQKEEEVALRREAELRARIAEGRALSAEEARFLAERDAQAARLQAAAEAEARLAAELTARHAEGRALGAAEAQVLAEAAARQAQDEAGAERLARAAAEAEAAAKELALAEIAAAQSLADQAVAERLTLFVQRLGTRRKELQEEAPAPAAARPQGPDPQADGATREEETPRLLQSTSLGDGPFGDAGSAPPATSVDTLALGEKSEFVIAAFMQYFGVSRDSNSTKSLVEILEVRGEGPIFTARVRYFIRGVGFGLIGWQQTQGEGLFEIRWDGGDDITVLARLDAGEGLDDSTTPAAASVDILALREKSELVGEALKDYFGIVMQRSTPNNWVDIIGVSGDRPIFTARIRYTFNSYQGSGAGAWGTTIGEGLFEIRWDGEDDITVLARLDGGEAGANAANPLEAVREPYLGDLDLLRKILRAYLRNSPLEKPISSTTRYRDLLVNEAWWLRSNGPHRQLRVTYTMGVSGYRGGSNVAVFEVQGDGAEMVILNYLGPA